VLNFWYSIDHASQYNSIAVPTSCTKSFITYINIYYNSLP
jgi:hypothetical protein